MRLGRLLGVFALVVAMAGVTQAAGRPRLYKKPIMRNVAQVTTGAVKGAVAGVSQGIAQAKAEQQAREGRMRHVGGSFGAGRYEGVGFSTVSADAAIRQCCYWGQKTPVEIGVAKGARGWFATVLYR